MRPSCLYGREYQKADFYSFTDEFAQFAPEHGAGSLVDRDARGSLIVPGSVSGFHRYRISAWMAGSARKEIFLTGAQRPAFCAPP